MNASECPSPARRNKCGRRLTYAVARRLSDFMLVRSNCCSMTLNTFRARRRTGGDGESRVSASRSDAELTNGITLVMTREGYFLARRLMKDCADGIAKTLVGHAVGQASALGMRSMSIDTVSMSSCDGRNGNMQRSTSPAISESNA